MPSKRSNLSYVSKHAKRSRLRRLKESPKEREKRLELQRCRKAAALCQETPSEREERLDYHRRHMASLRSSESSARREKRLAADRISHAKSRNEARIGELREIRLSTEISQYVEMNEREQRLCTDSIRYQNSSSIEVYEETESSLSADDH